MSFKCFQDCTPKIYQSLIKVLQIDQRNQIQNFTNKITNNKKKASSRKNNPKIIFLKFGYFLCSDYKSYLNFIKKTKSKWERKKRH